MPRRSFSAWWRSRRASGLTCREVVELVTAYLEDVMPPAERVRFEEHLAACDGCSAYVEQMRLTLETLGRITPEELDPKLAGALVHAFRSWHADPAG